VIIPVDSIHNLSVVMPGLVPGIHVLRATTKAWMAGTSLAMTESLVQFQRNMPLEHVPLIVDRDML
jgi:hypothetical protein